MNKTVMFSFIFLFSVFISSLSQIMLKKSALKNYDNRIREYLNPLVISAYGIFLLSSFITLYAYKYVPLSMGPILESSGYVFVGILSYLILKEKLNKRKITGMAVILLGIIIFSWK